MNIFDWLKQNIDFQECDSTALMYDYMESQSNELLPIIYQPFDIDNLSHWRDRGYILDFHYSVGEGNILDFGPGDGWPSLMIAPFTNRITGVEASNTRVEVCRINAARLGIQNVEFVHVKPGDKLPFENNFFDGITAASSIEQTPDPFATLSELYRVLKPGGKLRMYYESLAGYRDGREKEMVSWQTKDSKFRIDIYNRIIDREETEIYSLEFDLLSDDITTLFRDTTDAEDIPDDLLKKLNNITRSIDNPCKARLVQPDCRTWLEWMGKIGFSGCLPTRNGGILAELMFNTYKGENRPTNLDQLDELLIPFIAEIIKIKEPVLSNPMITAIK